MSKYDPLKSPDPAEWLALGESERIVVVELYHRRAKIRLPSLRAHAAFHAIVETQIAMRGEIPARETLERLMDEGLDRHDAVHAIGSALAGHMYGLMKEGKSSPDPNAEYFQRLKELTAAKWRESGD